ncbi:hypothetical protein [Streptomyces sp. NPDC102282]|uniref:hypothetical protein n=1 Tax=Streptomyces sp. NPDC102282 TaxID=3366154 RepID=UPI0037FAD308
MLRSNPTVFGPVASNPVSRLIEILAASEEALRALRSARARAHEPSAACTSRAEGDHGGDADDLPDAQHAFACAGHAQLATRLAGLAVRGGKR